MGSVKQLNSKAEVMGKSAALFMNINASKGLHEVMKSNLGPKGTIKMLVGGSGGMLQISDQQNKMTHSAYEELAFCGEAMISDELWILTKR